MGHLSDMRIYLIKNINIVKLKQTYSKLKDNLFPTTCINTGDWASNERWATD